MGSIVAYGYRMNERGRVVHKLFDRNELLYGEAARSGWVDSPSKVEGHALAEANAAARRAANAGTNGREPKPTGEVYGTPRVEMIDTPKGQRARSTKTGRFAKA